MGSLAGPVGSLGGPGGGEVQEGSGPLYLQREDRLGCRAMLDLFINLFLPPSN